jgi:hypothetical protein
MYLGVCVVSSPCPCFPPPAQSFVAVVALAVVYFVLRNYKTLVSIKKHERKKKRLAMGPKDVRRVIWARFDCGYPPCHISCH